MTKSKEYLGFLTRNQFNLVLIYSVATIISIIAYILFNPENTQYLTMFLYVILSIISIILFYKVFSD